MRLRSELANPSRPASGLCRGRSGSCLLTPYWAASAPWLRYSVPLFLASRLEFSQVVVQLA